MYVVSAAMTQPAILTGDEEHATLILRNGLVRPSVMKILAAALRDVIPSSGGGDSEMLPQVMDW